MYRDKQLEIGSGFRVMVLVIVLVTLMFFFRLHIITTIITFECWSISDIWESKPYFFSPYASYSICLGLLFLWSIVELFVGIHEGNTFSVVVSCFSTFIILGFFLALFHFWQLMRIMDGRMEPEEYLIKFTNFVNPEVYLRYGEIPSWENFVIAERCEKGLAITTMNNGERIELREKYELLYREILSK